MTKSLKITLMLSLSFSLSDAQNLVPNPSFEVLDSCPTGSSQIDRATGWLPFTSSPDLIHFCWFYYYTCPASGYGVARLIFDYNPTLYHEIMGAKLIDTLLIGTKYYVSFKVKFASYYSDVAINKIGIQFSTKKYCYSLDSLTNLCDSTPAPINNFAHIYTNDVITDSINWTLVSGSFVADSSYSYIMVGNFFDTSYTDTINIDELPSTKPVYYIDDVCVSEDSLTCIDITNQIIDFSANNTTIQEGSYINFNANTVVDYDSYLWLFAGGTPNTSQDSMPSMIFYDSSGTYSVTLIANSTNGCSDTVIKNNYITVTNPTIINESFDNKKIFIYPNPATEKINIFSLQQEIKSLNIYDVYGKLIMKNNGVKDNTININVSAFVSGFYLVEIISENMIFQTKLFVTLKP